MLPKGRVVGLDNNNLSMGNCGYVSKGTWAKLHTPEKEAPETPSIRTTPRTKGAAVVGQKHGPIERISDY